MIRHTLAIAAAILLLPHPAAAQAASPNCPAPVAPAGEFSSWADTTEMKAARDAAGLPQASLPLGQAARVRLLPVSELTYILPPERPAKAASHGGMIRISIAQPGTYRVALGTAAWVDAVTDGKAIASTAHGHGPACSGIRKIVDFVLEPGDYVLQFSSNAEPDTTLLVIRKP